MAKADAATPETPHRRTNRIILLLVLILIGAVLVKAFLFQSFFIPSGSMQPTLSPGDRVLVYRLAYSHDTPKRGDIVVFSDPHQGATTGGGVAGALGSVGEELGVVDPKVEDYVKRVIGLPGETLQARGGEILIDGVAIQEPYLTGVETDDFGPIVVPSDAIFVLGDARSNSDDSRYSLGPVPLDHVIGEVAVRFWPPSKVGGL